MSKSLVLFVLTLSSCQGWVHHRYARPRPRPAPVQWRSTTVAGIPSAAGTSGEFDASEEAASRRALGRKRERLRELCQRCVRPPSVCVCCALPPKPLATSTRVLVLQHPNERKRKTVSTVKLMPLSLANIEVKSGYLWPREGDGLESLRRAIREGYTPLLLFPGAEAIALNGGAPFASMTPHAH